MSEGRSAQGIDPRFDPRFQRGYVPSPESEAAAVETPPQKVVRSPPAPTAPAPGRIPRLAARSAEPAEHAHVAMPPTTSEVASADAAEPDASVDPAVFVEPDLEGVDEAEERPTRWRWLWIALGASVGCVMLGVGLFWSYASDPGGYMGRPGTGYDATLAQFVMSLAPGLVQAGVIGVVVALASMAIFGRRKESGR
ncbi:hypothetical protein [Agromyces albus]|uniref:hypothetical protein n=1 Tax=Agromyces albus TaxID=205332 RepID=UPI00278B12F9|nr:hypothetical protein [Agromyces albus]MDQ0577735.1 hypothetical protein [Agromyces albus]